ncbi:MAG: M23 family metallopeptidase [Actinobacteria bacterium]|nr:M23 family metallopeptidase [Actinomycetota bacterium]
MQMQVKSLVGADDAQRASGIPWLIRNARFRALTLFVVVFVVAVLWWSQPVEAGPCWMPPVDGVVTDPFREPPCIWCAGNRGIDYRVARSTVVRAPATGRVTFSGTVVGTIYVVIEAANGWRLTHGKLDVTHLEQGDVVVAGAVIGTASDAFFFGVRNGATYVDPGPFLGRLVGRPRLIPSDGSPPRPSTATRLRCQVRSGPR